MALLPRHWRESAESSELWPRLRAARRSVLMLDYDGTLAPFQNNRLEAYPYPGVEERLSVLAGLPNLRLVLVTGRAVREFQQLLRKRLGPELKFEIWGNHGWEHLDLAGSYRFFPLEESESKAIAEVKRRISQLGFLQVIETKPASVAVHWRGLRTDEQQQIRAAVYAIQSLYAGESSLQLLPFDGGLELRSEGRTKGTVVKEILSEEAGLPAAYLGDDWTDEDAFSALYDRGVAVLVRDEPRESSAQIWLKPPEELLQFLDEWIGAASTNGDRGDANSHEISSQPGAERRMDEDRRS